MELATLHWSTNTDADEMKSQALINARRAFQDQEARVQYVLLLENVQYVCHMIDKVEWALTFSWVVGLFSL